jgi:hypothetical protein
MKRAFLLSAFLVAATPASAQQIFETVGIRALGMGGAFVAVADDATAVYWNPAGLPGGSAAGGTLEWNQLRTGDQTTSPVAGPTRRYSHFVSLGSWPLGLSYARLETTDLRDGTFTLESRSLRTRQFGLTVVQTLLPGLVLGSTVKYERGTVSAGTVADATVKKALDTAAEAKGKTTGAFDLDVGLMLDMSRVRAGLAMRNVRQATFGDVSEMSVQLKRQARFGVAVMPGNGVTLAFDADLNTVDLRDGLRRIIAFGGEIRPGGRLAVRSGVRWNRAGDRRPVVATGLSVMIKPHVWVDMQYTHSGVIALDRGFGVALRAGL